MRLREMITDIKDDMANAYGCVVEIPLLRNDAEQLLKWLCELQTLRKRNNALKQTIKDMQHQLDDKQKIIRDLL